jgi:hypothetical protein
MPEIYSMVSFYSMFCGNCNTHLLEHLVDIRQHSAVEISVLVHPKAISEATSRHLQGDILDSLELGLDSPVIWRKVAQSSQDF